MQLPAFADRAWVRRGPPQLDPVTDRPAGCSHAPSTWSPLADTTSEQPPSSSATTATPLPRAAWKFSVMSYNILSDVYAHHFAPWLYKDVPQHCIPWSYRLPLLVQEMLYWDVDVICLQEVSRFEELELELRPGGYRGLFLRRGGRRRDGCAVFWKAQRLALLGSHHVLFSELGLEDNVALVVQLQPLAAGGSAPGPGPAAEPSSSGSSSIVVATTHVCFDPNKGDVKLGQVRELIARVDELLRRSPGAVAVITGDFNLVPCCPIYDFISRGQLDFGELSKRRLSGQVKGFGHQQFFQALQSSAECALHARTPQQPASSVSSELQLWSQLPALSVPRTSQPRCSGSGCAPSAALGAGDQSPSSVPSGSSTPQAPPTAAPAPSPGPADPAQPGLPLLGREPASAAGVSGFLAASQQEPHFERPSAPAPAGHVHRSWSVKAARAALGADALDGLLQRQQQQIHRAGSMDQPPGPPLAAGPRCVSWNVELGGQALVVAAACPPPQPDATVAPGHAQPQPPSADDADGGGGERTSGSGMRMRRASSVKAREPGVRECASGALKGSLVARHPLHLVSSYHALQGEEPMFTSVHSGFIGTCDYIWYTPEASSASNASRPEPGTSGGPPLHPRTGAGDEVEAGGAGCAECNGTSRQLARLLPLAVLAPPRIQLLEGGLPAPAWGSDHVSILCEFALEFASADS